MVLQIIAWYVKEHLYLVICIISCNKDGLWNLTYYYPRKLWEVVILNAMIFKKILFLLLLLNKINIVILGWFGLLLILYSSFKISVQVYFIFRHQHKPHELLVNISVPYFLGEAFVNLVYFRCFKIYCGSQKYLFRTLI